MKTRRTSQIVGTENVGQLKRKLPPGENENPVASQPARKNKKRATFSDITNALNGVLIDSTKKEVGVCAKDNDTRVPPLNLQALKEEKDDPSPCPPLLPRHTGRDSTSLENLVKLAQSSSSSSNSEIEITDASATPSPSRRCKKKAMLSGDCLLKTQPPTEYDQSIATDICQVPLYAKDIFQYYRNREVKFKVAQYVNLGGEQRGEVSNHMRSILVDWMVEVQENFELNHETLYLGVKMTDIFLSQNVVVKENLQLVGATAMFIAAKYDERYPPVADDFVYICDDAYTKQQFFQMEIAILRALDFDLGIPLSYRFLRRFAKATKSSMETLTLARYVLETALLFAEYVTESESRMAAASFLLAERMKQAEWTPSHALYSGYSSEELDGLMWRLNKTISGPPPARSAGTVKAKYSHAVFYEVAKTSPLPQPGTPLPPSCEEPGAAAGGEPMSA